MSLPQIKTRERIKAALSGQTLTSAEISQRSGVAEFGVESAIKSMWKRGETVRLKQRTTGEPYRYRNAA